MRPVLWAAVLGVVLLGSTSAQDAAPPASTEAPTVKAYLQTAKCSIFLNLLTMLQLDSAMDSQPMTVFAPNDEAFAKFFTFMNMSMNSTQGMQMLVETFPVSSLLRYHFSPQVLTLDTLPHGQRIQTFLASETQTDKLRISVDRMVAAPSVIFRGWESFATAIKTDVKAGQGIVHVLDNVLLPRMRRDPGFYPPTLIDMLTFHSLSMLRWAIGTAGLWDGLKELNKTVTLMAPTNEAIIGAMDAMNTTAETVDQALLANLVRYHVADGLGTTSRMMQNGTVFTWLPDRHWNFKRDGNGTVQVVAEKNTANIIIKDSFSASGCVVHVIDSMLFPTNLMDKP